MNPRTSSTVIKALSILDLFLDQEDGLSVTQISCSTGINMSTVVRLCATLEKSDYLSRNSRGVYYLGHKIDRLAEVFRLQLDIESVIRPILTNLRNLTGESASFYTIESDKRVCLFRVDSLQDIRHVVDEGTRLPLNKGVVGRVLMAFSGKSGAAFNKIRKNGYLSAEGRESFTSSLAAPVLSKSGILIGALVISGLSSRFTIKERNAVLPELVNSCTLLQDQLPAANLNYRVFTGNKKLS